MSRNRSILITLLIVLVPLWVLLCVQAIFHSKESDLYSSRLAKISIISESLLTGGYTIKPETPCRAANPLTKEAEGCDRFQSYFYPDNFFAPGINNPITSTWRFIPELEVEIKKTAGINNVKALSHTINDLLNKHKFCKISESIYKHKVGTTELKMNFGEQCFKKYKTPTGAKLVSIIAKIDGETARIFTIYHVKSRI